VSLWICGLRLGFTDSGRFFTRARLASRCEANLPRWRERGARHRGLDIGFVAAATSPWFAALILLVPEGEASMGYRLVWRHRLE
jgi:hypothetical protein